MKGRFALKSLVCIEQVPEIQDMRLELETHALKKKLLASVLRFLILALLLLVLVQNSWAIQGAYRVPEQVIDLPWGKGPGQAGKIEGQEGDSEGPASFALSLNGDLYLLDQVNARVLKFNHAGTLISQFSIPGRTFQDIEISPDGKIVLLDPLVLQTIVILDPSGKEITRYDLGKFVVARKGHQSVGEMFFYKDGLYLRNLHSNRYFRPLDNNLQIVKYNNYSGKPFKNSSQILKFNVALDKNKNIYTVTLMIEGLNKHNIKKEKTVYIKADTVSIHLLASDADKNIHCVYSHINKNKIEKFIGLKFDENFNQIGQFQFIKDQYYLPISFYVNFKASLKGEVYHMNFTKRGIQIRRWK